jgi:uracil-DNA glycosylase
MAEPLHQPLPPFAACSGPRDARIALVGETWGEQEALVGKPFVGASGQELTRLLSEAGIDRGDCFLTNAFNLRPYTGPPNARLYSNDFELLCSSRSEVGPTYTLPPISSRGSYVRPEFLPELDRLANELSEVRPNLIVAVGGKALWALCRTGAIGTMRGTIMPTTLAGIAPPLKVLPTYHPAFLFRGGWHNRPIVVADLMKAKREGEFPEIRRPRRMVLVRPTLAELENWVEETLATPPPLLGVDIETYRRTITMIGFASGRGEAVVCPFIGPKETEGSYWPTPEVELHARELCQRLLSSAIPKVTQNGLYDIQYLMDEGFELRAFEHDTMLLHHSLYPEMLKGLGFLGSIYTGEPAWKIMRTSKEEFKRDE